MRTTRLLAPLLAIALLAGACGGSSDTSSPSTDGSSTQPTSDGGGETTPAESSDISAASGTEITIADFAFGPKKTEVRVGDTVVWTNEDDILHTVTSGVGQKQGIPGVTEDKDAKPDGVFDQEMEFETTFEFAFDKAGTYKYFCAIHPGMVGVITVK